MKKSSYHDWIGIFFLLSAIWGGAFFFVKITVFEFGFIGTSFLRIFFGMLILLPGLFLRNYFKQLKNHWKKIFFIGLFIAAIPWTTYSFALQYISAGLASIINATTPMFGAIVASIWLKEKLNSIKIFGLILGFLGIFMLSHDDIHLEIDNATLGILAALVSTTCYGFGACYIKKYLSTIPPVATSTGSLISASIVLLPFALFYMPDKIPSISAWGSIFFLGFICSGYAYFLYFGLVKKAGATVGLLVTFLIPVFAILYGFVFLNEKVTLWMLFSALIIVFGTSLVIGIFDKKKFFNISLN
jgi:drug/metabolite transporter (DMT)-like permease